MQQSKLEFVDVARGLAILSVVTFHVLSRSNVIDWLPEGLQFVAQQAAHGVQLFFIVSAFTLFRSHNLRLGQEAVPLRSYFIRRVFRIAPMYYLGIAYYLFQNGFGEMEYVGVTFRNSLACILANVFLVFEFNPYFMWLVPGSWSVAAELSFYLILPLLFRWIPDLRAALRFLGISIVLRVASWYFFQELPLVEDVHLRFLYANWVLPTQLPVFALGIVMYFLLRGDAWPRLGLGDMGLWVGLVFAEVLTRGGRVLQQEVVLSVGFLLMLVLMSRYEWKGLLSKVLRHIGKVSFSLYVLHWGVIYWLDQIGWIQMEPSANWVGLLPGVIGRWALVVTLGVLLSTLTYHLVERPGQRLGAKLEAALGKM